MRAVKLLYPRGPRSGPSYAVSVHHHLIGLIRPTRQHIPISPTRLIRNAFAVRPTARLGDQRVVPSFRGLFFVGMSSSATPRLSAACTQFLRRQRWPSDQNPRSWHLPHPHPPIPMGTSDFGASPPFAFATTCQLARPPVGADRAFTQPTRTFTSGLPTGWSPAPSPDMTTVATGQFPPAGLSPARAATSFAARIFSTLFCESFLACLVPYPAVPSGACACYLLRCHRPSPLGRLGRLPAFVHDATSRGSDFRGCRHSVMFRPSSLFASQVAPTATVMP